MPTTEEQIEVGDHVYVGKPTMAKVHWKVVNETQRADGRLLCLESGMTGRRLYRFPHELTLHSKAAPNHTIRGQ